MQIIDADSHVIDSSQTWAYLDPAQHARRPLPISVPVDTDCKDWNSFWLTDLKVRHFGATPTEGNLMA